MIVTEAPKYGSSSFFQIRCQEVDVNRRLKVSSLLMLMQETSMENALKLQISIWDAAMGNTSWVLLRKEVDIIQSVSLGSTIQVITYPAGFDRILAYRDFIIYNDKHQLIATASSTWTLMNLDTRKVERIPKDLVKVAYLGETLPIPASRLDIADTLIPAYEYKIRYGDLDWNGHVNNIVLTKLMIQATPLQVLQNSRLKQFKIHIKSECLLDEIIQIKIAQVTSLEIHYQMISLPDNRLVAMSIALWSTP